MKKELSTMPVTLVIIFIWLTLWILTLFSEHIAPALCGNGIAKIGNEYYRLLTAILVHTDVIHLLINISAMFWIGFLYEHRVGSLKFLMVGAICGILAQVVFLCIYRNAEGSIGGSALNYALCGFALTMQIILPDYPKITFGTWSGSWLIIYLIAANIPFLPFINITTVVMHAIAFILGVLTALLCYLFEVR